MPETKATFHRAGYDGEYRVAYNGEHVGYISQALDRNAVSYTHLTLPTKRIV